MPPTDPRYLTATRDQIIEDYWLNFYAENGVKDEIEDESFDQDEVMKAIENGEWEDLINV